MLTREEYATIVEAAPVLIWRADATGACDYFNERWLQFRGRTLEQECGNGWLEGVHPQDRAGCLSTWSTYFSQRSSFEMDYRLLRHDGEYRWIHDCGVPVLLADGGFGGFIGSCIEFKFLLARSSGPVQREMKNLRGLLSLCSWCHRVEDSDGTWVETERYLLRHSGIVFTHGICPDCLQSQAAEP